MGAGCFQAGPYCRLQGEQVHTNETCDCGSSRERLTGTCSCQSTPQATYSSRCSAATAEEPKMALDIDVPERQRRRPSLHEHRSH
jgi:hypothetical protein